MLSSLSKIGKNDRGLISKIFCERKIVFTPISLKINSLNESRHFTLNSLMFICKPEAVSSQN
jgi:hypothetical protein